MLRIMRVDVTTWSLEITAEADLRAVAAPAGSGEIRRAMRPSPELGRFLYASAGGNWYWTDRLGWTYDQWLERLSDPFVETWVMYQEGTPAGYFELYGTANADVEIAYLGIFPAFMGDRLGGWLLSEAIRRGFAMGARRVWVHTCSLDSPKALSNYRARGMRVFTENTEAAELDDSPPGPWPGAGVHGPQTSMTPIARN